MNTIAERTGGRAFYNTNNIQGSIRRAISDGQSNYELGYYPDHGKWDGKFHEIKLKVNRPGLQIHYRKGYFASADLPSNAAERKATLDTAVISPIDGTNLSIRTEVNRFPPPKTGELQFNVALNLREFSLEEKQGRHVGRIEMILVQKAVNGTVVSLESKSVDLNFVEKRYEEMLASGFTMTRNLPIAPGATQLRIIMRDSQSGATGSVTVPINSFFQN